MSFISDAQNEYNTRKAYSNAELEHHIAENIIGSLKHSIEWAIKSGKSYVARYYERSDGSTSCLDLFPEYDSVDAYLNSRAAIPSLDSFGSPEGTIQKAIREKEKELDLHNIEIIIHNQLLELGAKKAEVYVQYRDYYMEKIRKTGFFREYYVDEPRPLSYKFKVCYFVSW